MFDEEANDRTLPPTERRRREARLHGQIARSPELSAAAVLLISGLSIHFLAIRATTLITSMMRSSISRASEASIDLAGTSVLLHGLAMLLAQLVIPIIAVAAAIGLLANLVQVGWVWSPQLVQPRLRLGLGNWRVRSTQAIARTGLVCLLAWLTWNFVVSREGRIRSLAFDEPLSLLVLPAQLWSELSFQLAIALSLYALFDYGVRYWQTEQSLKMTAEERRQELREDGSARTHRRKTAAAQVTAEIEPIRASGR